MNFVIGITAKISEIFIPLGKSVNKSILIGLGKFPSKESCNANANSQTKINSLVSLSHEILLEGIFENNRITKFP